MHFSAFFVAAALPFLVAGSPTERRSSARDNSGLSRRAEDIGCTFAGKLGNSYVNNPVGDGEGKSCFGWPNGGAITCGGPWDEAEANNIKQAVRDQATKDGQWESSDAGEWTATFMLATTAFDDRDTSAFDAVLDENNVEDSSAAGQMSYYWQRNGNFISVDRHSCPGSLFGKE
ncbi:MAG: hypothetical protein LQ346_003127 [Caloplaca aetnensis]|nr:MAG: hypothetical protein LQ346_003127 [Caloplaca aetnensis]